MLSKWPKNLKSFWSKCRLMKTVAASFDTTVRQMTEMSQWPKMSQKKLTEMSQRNINSTTKWCIWQKLKLALTDIRHAENECFLLLNELLIPFRLSLQPTESRQAIICLWSIGVFTCVLELLLIPHRKYPGEPRETHAQNERVAPRARAARQWRSKRYAKSGISHDNERNKLPGNLACRVCLKNRP